MALAAAATAIRPAIAAENREHARAKHQTLVARTRSADHSRQDDLPTGVAA